MEKTRKYNPGKGQRFIAAVVITLIAAAGVYLLTGIHAASPYISSEAENGTLNGATQQSDSNASGGKYVQFGTASGGGGPLALHVSGSHLVDGSGQVVRLHGANRSGAQYACIQGWGIWDGPVDDASLTAMQSWKINAVRVPLNEECWLATSNVNAQFAGTNYQNEIKAFVKRIEAHNMNVILDLHWTNGAYNGSFGQCPDVHATCQKPMADAQYTPSFWSSVASTFKGDDAVIFDLFNEPFNDQLNWGSDPWACLRDGGGSCSGAPYQVAGMQSMLNAVRTTGATNVVMVGGLTWDQNLTQWLQYKPNDPQNNLAASFHLYYPLNGCSDVNCWNSKVGSTITQVPVVTGEFGETDCNHGFNEGLMNWLDGFQQSYIGWAWNTSSGCGSDGPSLITDYTGTPTSVDGQDIKNHYLAHF